MSALGKCSFYVHTKALKDTLQHNTYLSQKSWVYVPFRAFVPRFGRMMARRPLVSRLPKIPTVHLDITSYISHHLHPSRRQRESSEATRSRAFENEAMAMDSNSTALIVTDIFSKPTPLHCEEDTSTSCVDFVAVWRRLRYEFAAKI
eukprot:scaffold6117_cov88-Skeletonema_marinoi.AAC.1